MQQLDDSQRAFCEAPENNNVRLLAPAGCGKTLCLLHRCKYLASRKPHERMRFLIVTFTRAAEQELSARLSDDQEFTSLKRNASKTSVEVTTLNAWGWKCIQSRVSQPELIKDDYSIYLTINRVLYDTWNKHKYIREAMTGKKVNKIERRLMSIIDNLKSLGFDHTRHKDFSEFLRYLNILYDQDLQLRLEEQLKSLYKCKILKNSMLQIPQDLGRELENNLFEFNLLNARTNIETRESIARLCYKLFFKFWIEVCSELKRRSMFTLEDQKYIAFLNESKCIEDEDFLSGQLAYDYVFVDEFQDINPLDLNLVKAIVKRHQSKLTIIGDDDQAIFEWRGATPQYILDPRKFFNLEFDTYKLQINYRSPSNIVEYSQRLISKNENREIKSIRSASQAKAEIELYRTENLLDHLKIVHDLINESSNNHNPSHIAIIGRDRSQIIPYQVYFASEMIPFYAAEDLQFYLSETFDRLLSLLKIKIRMKSGQSIRVPDILELCNYIRKFPLNKNDRRNFKRYLYDSNINELEQEMVFNIIKHYSGSWKGSNSPSRASRVSFDMAEALEKFVRADSVSAVLQSFQEKFIGLQRDFGEFSKADEDIFYTDPPFQQLVDYARSYEDDYDKFLHSIRFAQDTLAKTNDECEENPLKHSVHLMTAHRAKGKEFDTVVLLNVKNGVWPDRRADSVLEKLEAERRLFYVVFTRAKKKIVMFLGESQDEDSPYINELELPEEAGCWMS